MICGTADDDEAIEIKIHRSSFSGPLRWAHRRKGEKPYQVRVSKDMEAGEIIIRIRKVPN